MASSSKRHNFTVSLAEVNSKVDIISTLPEHILSHILSFLPTKYAAATSILSTRWKYLWASISNLDFNLASSIPNRILISNPESSTSTDSFINFVDRIFMLSKSSSINTFRLRSDEELDCDRVNLWVSAALSRNVRNLDLCISITEFDMLPCEIFNNKTLVVLKLSIENLPTPRSVCLLSLKVLHLNSIRFRDDTSIEKLISNCPVLEELEIYYCSWEEELMVFNVSAHALQRLNIADSFDRCSEFELLVIDAPNLLYLRYSDAVPVNVSVISFRSLVKADIRLTYFSAFHDGLSNLMKAIASVKHLIYSPFWEAESSSNWLPMFPNLISLELRGIDGWKTLPHLLEHTCHIERLIFTDVIPCKDFEGALGHWFRLEQVPSCLSFHLKTIEIFRFSGLKGELEAVKFFLKKAKVLEKLILHGSKCLPEKEVVKAIKELLMLPRGSKKCQVETFFHE